MDFNNIDSKIEINLKRIDFYHNLYQRNQNKFSFLIIIYSFICFYILEIIKYPFREKYEVQDVTAYSVATGAVQTNNLPINALGIYNNGYLILNT